MDNTEQGELNFDFLIHVEEGHCDCIKQKICLVDPPIVERALMQACYTGQIDSFRTILKHGKHILSTENIIKSFFFTFLRGKICILLQFPRISPIFDVLYDYLHVLSDRDTYNSKRNIIDLEKKIQQFARENITDLENISSEILTLFKIQCLN